MWASLSLLQALPLQLRKDSAAPSVPALEWSSTAFEQRLHGNRMQSQTVDCSEFNQDSRHAQT
jgi:hypothetical protein